MMTKGRIPPALALLLVASMLLSGCWNRKELNEVSIVLAIGIDWSDGQYEMTVQVVDPSQMTRNRLADRSPVVTVTQKAPTLMEAFRKMTTKSSRKLYVSHIRLVLFDEATARQGIQEPLDIMFRDHEFRPDFYLAIARDCKAKDIIQLMSPTEVLPAVDLYKSLKVSEKAWAPTAAVNITDMLQNLVKEGVEPVLTGVTLVGSSEAGKSADNVKQPRTNTEFKYTGIGLLGDGRLIGWLNESDSKAYNYINNRVSSTVGRNKCPGVPGVFAVEVISARTRKVAKLIDGEPYIIIKLNVEATINEVHCPVDLTDEKVFLEMEQIARQEFERVIRGGIVRAQHYGVDIFGFGEVLHRKYPREWREWRKDWNKRFKTLKVEIEEEGLHLRRIGKIVKPFNYSIEKE